MSARKKHSQFGITITIYSVYIFILTNGAIRLKKKNTEKYKKEEYKKESQNKQMHC